MKGKNIVKLFLSKNEIGTLLPLIIMAIVVGSINKNFFSLGNVIDILRTMSFTFIVAAPLTFLLVAADMDLSIGAVTSLGGVVVAFALKAGLPASVAILIALGAGAAAGFIKAFIIVYGALPAFIVTLGLQYVFNGIISITTQGMPISGFPDSFKVLGQARLFGMVHYTILFAVALGVVFYVVLTKTKFGRSVFAVGGNVETAYLAGICVKRVQITIHVMVSVFAALAGILMTSRFAIAQANAGSGTELTIMAAVIIGGTSLFGGVGTVVGSAIGCILLVVISNGLILMRIPSFWQNLIYGLILLISIAIDKYRQKINQAGL
ncbi:MAG: ABC transporter permease [Treponema sp.]|jgi:ribose transport system permease protein|nr:ABC transporter permease [Treponema sp.]